MRGVSLFSLIVLLGLSACANDHVAQFWRPISQPNILLPLDKAQEKLEYDLLQCTCGNLPKHIPMPTLTQYEPDQQRLLETQSVVQEEKESCVRKPSLAMGECMRTRGWEVTQCSGRMPVAGNGAVCTAYTF